MEFILEYDNEEYLILTDEFSKKDKTEVIRVPYSDEEGDWVEYEIQVFKRKGNKFFKEKVLELPEELRNVIGKNIQELLDRTFIANPYFDDLLIFFEKKVFTYQDQYKLIQCNDCNKNNLYQRRNKGNKTEYIEELRKLMDVKDNPNWPYKEKLLFQFTVSDRQSRLDKIDLDNLAKTIFDMFKEIVYDDDSQIVSFAGSKHSILNLNAFMVAIRRLEPNEIPVVQEHMYSGKMNSWQAERKQKQLLNKITHFRAYRK